jgi:oleandomycin transport system ATP-binding protein
VSGAAAVRSRIGLTGQYAAVDEALTGTDNLLLIARLLDLPRREARRRAAELVEQFGLAEAAGRRVRTYSGGMRRRLDLAASLIGRPDVLFLDEPTTGLDPRHRGELWEQLRGLRAGGVTVVLTTQYLEEADQLADDLVVLDHGRVIATGTSAALKAELGGQRLHVRRHCCIGDQRKRAGWVDGSSPCPSVCAEPWFCRVSVFAGGDRLGGAVVPAL